MRQVNDISIPCSCSVPAPDGSIVVISPSWLNQRTAVVVACFLDLPFVWPYYSWMGWSCPLSVLWARHLIQLLSALSRLAHFFFLTLSLPSSVSFSLSQSLFHLSSHTYLRLYTVSIHLLFALLSLFLSHSLSPLSPIVLTVRPCFSIWHPFLHNQHSTLNPSTPSLPKL